MARKHRNKQRNYHTPSSSKHDSLSPFLFDFNDEPSAENLPSPQKIIRDTTIDWDDEDLFGDDDAAFVDIKMLNSFSIVRTDCKKFFRDKSKFIALNAPKGSGKTTMCRMLEHKINNDKDCNDDAIWLRDPDIAPMPPTPITLSEWINRWSNRIAYAVLCLMVEKSEGIMTNSDLMEICNLRSQSGEQSKGLLQHFIQNFQLPFLKKQELPDKFEISYQDMLMRLDSKLEHKIWIFIDEVDQGFSNDEQLIFKNAGALIACRNLVSRLDNIVIRSTIRPNVLTIIQSEVDSMANIADSIIPLDWNALQIRSVIAKRVESYLERTKYDFMDNFLSNDDKEDWLLAQILKTEDEHFGLGRGRRLAHVTLAVLGKNRPRWVLNLLKNAASIANYNDESLITPAELFGCLTDYGNERIRNLASEFKSVCKKTHLVITRLSLAKKSTFFHHELLSFIEDKIIANDNIKITGVSKKATAIDVAELLYLIGVIDAAYVPGESSIRDARRLKKSHMDFFDQPILVTALSNTDIEIEKFIWEIHPAFRYSLGLERKKWK